jgi:SLT domain-containing protein
LFGIALARAASQRQGAYLHRVDETRALVARLAEGTMPKWTLPLSMYQWQRVIVSQKCCNSVLNILQRDRWAPVEARGVRGAWSGHVRKRCKDCSSLARPSRPHL